MQGELHTRRVLCERCALHEEDDEVGFDVSADKLGVGLGDVIVAHARSD